MTVTPQGQIYLCKTKLENDYKNQLTFINETTQHSYFVSTIQHIFTEYTYMKKDSQIYIGKNIDEIIDCNYLFYKNIGFSDKWYYCFITNMSYENENCTLVTIETDCFQTYYFDIVYHKCFVEREHVNNDTIGLHTVPENLETGEYLIDNQRTLQAFASYKPCFAVSELPQPPATEGEPPIFNKYGNVFNGVAYIVAENDEGASNIIRTYDKMGKADAIQYIFMIPSILAENITYTTVAGWSWVCKYGQIPSESGYFSGSLGNFPKPNSLDGYTPKNKKLLTYPYCYLNLDNNSGNACSLHYEDFTGNNYSFGIDCLITPSCSTKITPINYKKVSENFIYSLSGAKLPVCSWATDVYTNWITQQSVNNAITLLNAPTSMISGVIQGKNESIKSGVNDVLGLLSESYQKDLIPHQVRGNTNNGDVNFAKGLTNPKIYEFTIRNEFARIIDNYFTMYGYKVNTLKIPNITGRTNFNYVKTVDCNFTGDIPQSDLNIIKQMFNNGVTFWHNEVNMYNYDIENNIV